MKSSHLKFANPHLNNIDFEIIPNSPEDQLLGLLCVAGILITVVVFLIVVESLPANSFGPYLTALMIFVVLKLFRWSRKYLNNSTSIVKDPRAPIIYLRSFSDDREDDNKRWDHKTSEELIASALKSVGPVLAVKDPGQAHKFLGATRIAMGENWRVEIEKLISISQVVVVEANYTENLVWELQLLKNLSRPEQLIISFLSRDDYYESDGPISIGQLMNDERGKPAHFEKFDNAFSQIFGVSLHPYNADRLCFFYFDKAWRAKPVTLELADTPFRKLSFLIYTPFIFSRRYKRHLPFWKIKRALMLILHDNGIIAQTEYLDEIAAAGSRIETPPNDPARNNDTEPQRFRSGVLDLVGTSDRRINNEAKRGELGPVQSLLQEIDSFKSDKRPFLILGAVGVVVLTVIAGLALLDSNSTRPQSYLEMCRSAQCAIVNCSSAIEADPGNAQAYQCLGDAYTNNGNYQQAIADYDKAIELNPRFADAYYNRAVCYFNLGDYKHAISDTTLAKELEGKGIYFELRGWAFFQIHDTASALRDLHHAVELDSREASRFYYLSMVQEALKKHDEAMSNITSAIERDPGNSSYYAARATMHLSLKEYDLSISDSDQAIRLGPDLRERFYNRGLAYLLRKSGSKANDYRRAIEDFSSAISLDNSYRNAYRNRSFAYDKIGEKRLAETDFKTCQRLDRLAKK